eukprot:100545_1
MSVLCNIISIFLGIGLCYEPTPPIAGSTDNGCLFPIESINGIKTKTFGLHLWGSPQQRGIAHGYLLTTQIIDWIEFYLIQTRFKGIVPQYQHFYHFVAVNMTFPIDVMNEMNAIISGMKLSKKSLLIPTLNRNITITDIMAANAYADSRSTQTGPYLTITNANNECTQFVAHKTFSDNKHLITGRNMDGECDVYKVTVTHLIVFAIDSYNNSPKIISFLWPGIVGIVSGINMHGVYVMNNAGNMGPSPIINDITPISVIVRGILNNFDQNNFTSTTVQKYVIDNFASNASATRLGSSGGGAILMCGCDSNKQDLVPVFVLEMDRLNTVVREPMESPDLLLNDVILASNHFRKYGVNQTVNDPMSNSEFKVFGIDVRLNYYNSSWRYENGRSKLYSINRTIGTINLDSMKNLLQTVSHGTTEHSVITMNDEEGNISLYFAVANSQINTLWDAPYERWYNIEFNYLFQQWNVTMS